MGGHIILSHTTYAGSTQFSFLYGRLKSFRVPKSYSVPRSYLIPRVPSYLESPPIKTHFWVELKGGDSSLNSSQTVLDLPISVVSHVVADTTRDSKCLQDYSFTDGSWLIPSPPVIYPWLPQYYQVLSAILSAIQVKYYLLYSDILSVGKAINLERGCFKVVNLFPVKGRETIPTHPYQNRATLVIFFGRGINSLSKSIP